MSTNLATSWADSSLLLYFYCWLSSFVICRMLSAPLLQGNDTIVCHSVRRGKCFSEWGLHPEFQLLNRRNNSADDWFYPWCSSLSRGRLVTSRAWLCQDCCGVATETQAGCGSCWDSPTIIGWTSRDTKKTYQNLKQPWARSGKNRTVQLLQDHMYINMYIYIQYIYIYNTLYI